LQENVARLGNRELAVEFVEPDMPKTRGLTPAVRNYIQKERNAVWKQNLNQTAPRQQVRGQRI